MKQQETVAWLSLGSNLGNREQQLSSALQAIEKNCGKIIATSQVYQTAAWGKTDQPDFLNMVAGISTSLPPADLLRALLGTEKQMGRERGAEKWLPRTIDIDILLYGNEIIAETDLALPHPFLHERLFVLKPLCDVAPDLVHPNLNKKMKDLLEICPDTLPVELTSLRF